jgi:hypothetical protein
MVKYNDSNYSENLNKDGIFYQEKQFSKTKKKQNKYNFVNKNYNLDSDYFKSYGFSNIEGFTSNQSQFLQSPDMQSGMNLGQPMPNPYPSNPSNTKIVTIQQINSQIQQLNSNNINNSNNLSAYAQQSDAVLSQNQLTQREIDNIMNLTAQYNDLVSQYDSLQNEVMNNADNQVLSMNASTNPYLNSYIQISNGNIYYITNSGIAQPYASSNTSLPTNIQSLPNVKADRSYVYTTPVMQIGDKKYESNTSGYEGTNVYANNSTEIPSDNSNFVGCFETTIPSIQQTIMTQAPGTGENYTFQTCQTAAYDSGSGFFSFNLTNPTDNTGVCFLTNDASAVVQQGPALNYNYTLLWQTNLQPTVGNYMGINNSGNVVMYNSSNSEIWSSDASGSNSLSATNYVGCYQSNLVNITGNSNTVSVPPIERFFRGFRFTTGGTHNVTVKQATNPTPLMTNVTNSSNNTWETCYNYAYENNIPYFGVNGFDPITGNTTCLIGSDLSTITSAGSSSSCRLLDNLYYGVNNSNAVYSANNAPTNAFLTLNDNGLVMAFIGLNVDDVQSVTWQLDMSGQVQMINYDVLNTFTYIGSMQTGQTLQEGQIFCSPSGLIWFTVQNGNLMLYTSSNTPQCYLMNSAGKEYYAGDISMNALYQMNTTGVPSVLGNIGYVDGNSILYPYPNNMVGQGDTFKYFGNYDTSGTIIPYVDPTNGFTSNYYTGLDLSGSMQMCIDLSCNAFVMTTLTGPTNTQTTATKFMSTAFATPFTSSNSSYIPRYPDPNSQLYIRNPTVINSQFCNKDINDTTTLSYNNYPTNNTPMNMDMRCVQLTTTNNELNNLSNQINTLSNQIKSQISRLQNKTLTVNQQQQLNEIVLNTQFKNIDKVQNSVTQYQESSVNARNIKNDSQLVVLKENQSFILWSVLAISVALITIHVIR